MLGRIATRKWDVRSCRKLFTALYAVGATLFACATPVSAQSPQKITLAPCSVGTLAAQCGTFEVFENRAAKSGRKISLRVVVLPSTSTPREADPVVFLAGGPGQSAVELAKAAGPDFLLSLRRTRDVLLVDQRGTGESNALRCNLYGDPDEMSGYFGELFPPDALIACREELAKNADLAQYTTPLAIEDLDDVRAALGYARVNLLGASYGSLVALAYMRKFPAYVRAAALSGAAPLDYNLPLPVARGFDRAMAKLFADCSVESACHAAFPQLREEFSAVLEKLAAGPVKTSAPNPVTRKLQEVEITRAGVLRSLLLLMYSAENSRAVPLMIHLMAAGDYGFFAYGAFQVARGMHTQMDYGMHLTVACAEHVPFTSEREIRRQTTNSIFEDSLVREYQQTCRQWPRGQVSGVFLGSVGGKTPVLVLSGNLDPVMPPALGADVAREFSRGRHVVLANTSHIAGSDCTDKMISAFFAAGTADKLDIACADEIRRPAFLTPQASGGARPPSSAPSQSAQQPAPSRPSAPAPAQPGQQTGPQTRPQAPPQKQPSAPQPAPPRTPAPAPRSTAEEDRWMGTLDTGNQKLRLVLRMVRAADGGLTARLDSLDQPGAENLPVDSIRFEVGALQFEMRLIGATYQGRATAAGEISGTWTQAGRSWPLVFRREPEK